MKKKKNTHTHCRRAYGVAAESNFDKHSRSRVFSVVFCFPFARRGYPEIGKNYKYF